MNRKLSSLVAAVALSFSFSAPAQAEPLRVVATISPLHSLAASLLRGADDSELTLLLTGTDSPHHFHLRPSGAAALSRADVIFWMAENLESPLAKPIAARARPGAAVKLLDAINPSDLIHYADEHDDHSDDDHRGHDDHDGHDDHGHSEDEHRDDHDGHDDHGHSKDEHHDDHAGHDHGTIDPHVWLSPKLAMQLADAMADALIRADSQNESLYRANLKRLRGELSELDAELRAELSLLPSAIPALEFHDAYAYFRRDYGLTTAGAILDGSGHAGGGLSASRVSDLRKIAKRETIRCIFVEPQFNARVLTPITRGMDIRSLVLDPLGSSIPPGPDAHPQTLRAMAKTFTACAQGGAAKK